VSTYISVCLRYLFVSLNRTWQRGITITVLAFAADGGHAEVVDLLLKAGADVNAKGEVRFE